MAQPTNSPTALDRSAGPRSDFTIAVLPGDGIGVDVTAEAVKVLRAAQRAVGGFTLRFAEHECGAGCYRRIGEDLPRATLEAAAGADAVLLGAMGHPDVRKPDGTELTPQITLRVRLDLYAGVRPCRLYAGARSPLAGVAPGGIDLVILREQTEGLFASLGAGIVLGDRVATDTLIMTRPGVRRVCEFAFRLARGRRRLSTAAPRKVTCVDKANVFKSYAFFRKVFDEVAAEFPDVGREHTYIDAQALYLVQRPGWFDVLVTENLFGDILSDLAAGLVGGMGMAPSADLGDRHGVFQPAHGTAPDIAGKGVANPLAAILSAGMLLEWLGERHGLPALGSAGERVEAAVARVLGEGRIRPPDQGGTARTSEVGDAVAAALA
jgi:3-isopropylmalate dehydrogenase